MHARVSTYQSPAENLVASEEQARTDIVPKVLEMQGNRGIISLIDRQSGKSISITLWDSEESLHATEQIANQIRSEATDASGGEIKAVEQFEVSILELRQASGV